MKRNERTRARRDKRGGATGTGKGTGEFTSGTSEAYSAIKTRRRPLLVSGKGSRTEGDKMRATRSPDARSSSHYPAAYRLEDTLFAICPCHCRETASPVEDFCQPRHFSAATLSQRAIPRELFSALFWCVIGVWWKISVEARIFGNL